MFIVRFVPQAQEQAKLLRKNYPNSYKKLIKLLEELKEHPATGTGKVEKLKLNNLTNIQFYSRRLDLKNRLVYSIREDVLIVVVVSAYGHYEDEKNWWDVYSQFLTEL